MSTVIAKKSNPIGEARLEERRVNTLTSGLRKVLRAKDSSWQKMVIDYVKSGADVSRKFKSQPLLMHLWSDGQKELVSRILHLGVATLGLDTPDEEGETLLFKAMEGASSHLLRHLISRSNVNHQNSKGQTPLMLALKFGRYEVLSDLIDCGADPSLEDAEGNNWSNYVQNFKENERLLDIISELAESELFNPNAEHPAGVRLLSIAYPNYDLTKRLVGLGADVTAAVGGPFPLHQALEDEQYEIAELLAEACPESLNYVAYQGDTCIPLAHFILNLMHQNQGRTEKLLEFASSCGLSLNTEDFEGKSSLTLAVEQKNIEAVQFLSNDGDLAVTIYDLLDLFIWMKDSSDKEEIDQILKNLLGTSYDEVIEVAPFFSSIFQGKSIEGEITAENKESNILGVTPLMLAVGSGNVDAISELRQAGVDVSRSTTVGTVLDCLPEEDLLPPVVEALLAFDTIDFGVSVSNGNPAWFKLLDMKNMGTLRKIFEHRSVKIDQQEVFVEGTSKENALHYAVVNRDFTEHYAAVVDCLRGKGLSLESKTSDGKTALGLAVEAGSVEWVIYLHEIGAEVAHISRDSVLGIIDTYEQEDEKSDEILASLKKLLDKLMA